MIRSPVQVDSASEIRSWLEYPLHHPQPDLFRPSGCSTTAIVRGELEVLAEEDEEEEIVLSQRFRAAPPPSQPSKRDDHPAWGAYYSIIYYGIAGCTVYESERSVDGGIILNMNKYVIINSCNKRANHIGKSKKIMNIGTPFYSITKSDSETVLYKYYSIYRDYMKNPRRLYSYRAVDRLISPR